MKHAGKMGLLTFTEKRREFVIGITAKKVIDTTTGEIYPTISSAAKKLGKSRSTLRHWLNGKTKNRSSFILL